MEATTCNNLMTPIKPTKKTIERLKSLQNHTRPPFPQPPKMAELSHIHS